MISSRKNNRTNSDKLNLERKVDQLIEVSRQFVDGVSGTRPGQRRSTSFKQLSKRKVNNVTRWVSKKVDSFFDDEYDYEDNWYSRIEEEPKNSMKTFNNQENSLRDFNIPSKRPLTAISLRLLETQTKKLKSSDEDWPEAEDFQINRWKRTSLNYDSPKLDTRNNGNNGKTNNGRNLPKSSRRRI